MGWNQAVKDLAPKGWWKLDELYDPNPYSNAPLADSSGNKNHGSYWRHLAKLGRPPLIVGSQGCMRSIYDSSGIDFPANVDVSCNVTLKAGETFAFTYQRMPVEGKSPGYSWLMGGNATFGGGYALYAQWQGQSDRFSVWANGDTFDTQYPATRLMNAQRHFVVFTHDDRTMRVYVDGERVLYRTDFFGVNFDANFGWGGLGGKYDEFLYFNRMLTGDECDRLWNNWAKSEDGTGPGTVKYPDPPPWSNTPTLPADEEDPVATYPAQNPDDQASEWAQPATTTIKEAPPAKGSDSLINATPIGLDMTSVPTPNGALTWETGVEPEPMVNSGLWRSAWWKMKLPDTQWVTLDTELSTAGQPGNGPDMWLSVYWRNRDTGSYDLIAEDQYSGADDWTSKLTFKAGAEATYYIQVAVGNWYTEEDTYVLRTTASGPVPKPSVITSAGNGAANPGGDTFGGAQPILAGQSSRAVSNSTYTIGEPGEPQLVPTEYRSMWWTYVPTESGLSRVYVGTPGILAVMTGSTITDLKLVDMRHASGSQGPNMYVDFQAGVRYYIRYSTFDQNNRFPSLAVFTPQPCRAIKIPALNPAKMNPELKGEITGGLDDGSDSTGLHLYGQQGTSPNAGTAFNSHWPTTPEVAGQTILDVQVVLRGQVLDKAKWPLDRGPAMVFINSTTQSQFTSRPMSWGASISALDHRISLRDVNRVLQVSEAMLVNETPDAYPPAGWASTSNMPRWQMSGFGIDTTYEGYIYEAALWVYVFEDTYPVEPPDDLSLRGGQVGSRASFKGMRR